jgi:Cu+-exporting ATPase
MAPVTDKIIRAAGNRIELAIGGMTCASCAARIEKKLNRIDGVQATVNYATEKAKIVYPDGVTPSDLIATVEKTGYTAEVPAKPAEAAAPVDELASLRTRLWICLILTVPVIALSMVPAWQFTNWQWLSLALAGPVVGYGGAPFHRAAAVNLRHGAATMDT